MNLPNKLTVLRVIMVPFFVFFHADRCGRSCKQMDRTDHFLCGKSHRYAGWKNCKGKKSCDEFRKVYGSTGRQTAGMFCYDLYDPAWKTSGMVCDRHYCKRVYHQRFPSGSSRQRYCDRCKLLGKIQNGIPDVHADPSDRRSWRCI